MVFRTPGMSTDQTMYALRDAHLESKKLCNYLMHMALWMGCLFLGWIGHRLALAEGNDKLLYMIGLVIPAVFFAVARMANHWDNSLQARIKYIEKELKFPMCLMCDTTTEPIIHPNTSDLVCSHCHFLVCEYDEVQTRGRIQAAFIYRKTMEERDGYA